MRTSSSLLRSSLSSVTKLGQHRNTFISESFQKSTNNLLCPPKKCLTPAEVAFFSRLGLRDISREAFRSALSHPKLTLSISRKEAFEKYKNLGSQVMEIFTKDYISARFAKLPKDSKELAIKVYLSPKNISIVAKSVGIEFALIDFTGVPNITMPNLHLHAKKFTSNENSPTNIINPTQVYAEIFQALVGLIFSKKGALDARNFLDGLVFSCAFNKSLLCRPRNPMLKLARALTLHRRPEPDYRLLHESGRISNSSIYVVGAYSGLEKLAEAHGPSMLVAQERVAIEALRKIFLIETPNAPRSSDVLLKNDSIITKLIDLKTLLNTNVD